MTPDAIVSTLDALSSVRKTVEEHWQLIERFVCPGRGKFFQDEKSEHELTWRRRELYDSTAPMAAQTLAASIHGALTSAAIRWFDYQFRQEHLNKNQEAMKWVEECAEISYQTLQDSNFNLEASELYLDLVNYGTGTLVEEAVSETTWEGIEFRSIPQKEAYFQLKFNKEVIRLFRKMEMTPIQIVDKFGPQGCPTDICEAANRPGSVDEKHAVIFAIYERPENKGADTSGLLAPEARPFGWKYVLKTGAVQLGESGGFYEMPAFVPRWRQMSGSSWGYSPAMLALPDILTLNQLVELILRSSEKVVDPATITTERGIIGALDLEPAGLTVVRSMDQIKPYESGARFDVSSMQRDDLRRSIRSVFHVDQLELKESPAMTATEVQVRYEMMQRLLGPTLGRLQNDFLDPLVTRTFRLLHRAGQLPPIPNIVAEMQGELDVQYTGPLVRAQRMQDVESMERWLGSIGAAAEVFPEMLDLVDSDAYGRNLARELGMPKKNMRSEAQVLAIREARQKAQANAAKAAQVEAEGNAAEALGKGGEALGLEGSDMAAVAAGAMGGQTVQ